MELKNEVLKQQKQKPKVNWMEKLKPSTKNTIMTDKMKKIQEKNYLEDKHDNKIMNNFTSTIINNTVNNKVTNNNDVEDFFNNHKHNHNSNENKNHNNNINNINNIKYTTNEYNFADQSNIFNSSNISIISDFHSEDIKEIIGKLVYNNDYTTILFLFITITIFIYTYYLHY